jgi:uncharacterized membrane protein YfcA
MDYVIICTVAIVVAALTLFSGFGLGTLLMPAFALFFPVSFAVAATAVVHLANNLFKALLIGRQADARVVVKFALPAAVFAAAGALVLGYISGMEPILRYSLAGHEREVTVVKVVIAAPIAVFAVLEMLPGLEKLAFDNRYIPMGGALSGFFGGLSGLQGALRSAFLIHCGLDKEAFVATGVMCAVVVDLARLATYGATFVAKDLSVLAEHGRLELIIAGILAAFLGSFIGVRLLRKTTMRAIQVIVAVMLMILAICLGAGLL